MMRSLLKALFVSCLALALALWLVVVKCMGMLFTNSLHCSVQKLDFLLNTFAFVNVVASFSGWR